MGPQLMSVTWMMLEDPTHACPLCRQHGWRTWIAHPFSILSFFQVRQVCVITGMTSNASVMESLAMVENVFREHSPLQSELRL